MSESRYTPLPPQVDLPAMERDVLALWHENDTFARSLARTEGGEPWTFYEGPPTANGMPGVHHVEARVFKDVFPRFRTMQGRYVVRKAGWDCHGLPVEIAVEKELGFSGKGDIEAYGVAEFNARCRASVERHVGEFEAMTERMGYWVDMSQAYRTMDPEYVQSVWWSLKQVFDKGLLTQDYRVAPYCPRCGTGLSDHELAQGYETVVDPSVYVRFPLTSGPYAGTAGLLVWTTTPWTLVSNTAVAVRPDVTYVTATDGEETLVVAEPLLEHALGDGWTVVDRFLGSEMEHWAYQRPFDLVDWPEGEPGHFVALADYVTTDDGTGLVHQAPAFGAEDLLVSRAYGLPVVRPVRPDGHFEDSVRLVGGQFFKSADKALVHDLQERGLLFRHLAYEHSYPHCWRCHTALLYYAQPSWYIRTTEVKDQLLAENERTNWFPDNIKWGRYGDWLHNNIDWALSRSRYWGTPLPIWVNDEDPTQMVCVGSLAELGELAGADLSATDPHRPYVDDVTFTRPGVPGTFRRVPEVIDGWYDSGSMPFAQWGYPHAEGSVERFEKAFPAQFISEAIDQTRGWFYTLMTVNTIVHGRSSYENVVCLGHIVAEDGRKMSKHLGNVLQPLPLMEQHGADSLRWFMAAVGSPWQQRRIGHAALQDIVRKTLLTYWNTASFLTLYADVNGWSPAGEAPRGRGPPGAGPVGGLRDAPTRHRGDRGVRDVRHAAGRPAARGLRRRPVQLVRPALASPVLGRRPGGPRDAARVAVGAHPAPGAGRAVRDRAGLAGRRPRVRPGRRRVGAPRATGRWPIPHWSTPRCRSRWRWSGGSWSWAGPRARSPRSATGSRWGGRWSAHRAGRSCPTSCAGRSPTSSTCTASRSSRASWSTAVPRATSGRSASASPSAPRWSRPRSRRPTRTRLVAALREHGAATVTVDGEDVEVTADEVLVTETPREGWAVTTEGGETVALDLTITPELRRAGLAREVVRLVQEARKTSGLQVTDRVALTWEADGELAEALTEHADLVATEVLATSFEVGSVEAAAAGAPSDGTTTAHEDPDLGLRFTLRRSER